MCGACGWVLLALSASYCIYAVPVYASCSAVCISICAVHERLGASRPVCSIAFALYLWVQHVIVIYVFVACTVACIIIFVAMLLCGSGAIALPATKY